MVNNIHVKYGLDADSVKWAFSHFYLANWHPLTWLSHALDCELFRVRPGPHHMVNAIFHAVNVLLLYWVMWLATRRAGPSLMVAALFALHPINVESVVWISERKNLLSMLFFLLALGAYTWYARRPRVAPYAVVFVLFACGLMAKPQVITFPCILLLWDYWPLERLAIRHSPFAFRRKDAAGVSAETLLANTRERSSGEERRAKGEQRFLTLLAEKIPLFLLAAASAVITFKAQHAGGAMTGPINTFPLRERIANAVISYLRYAGKAVWPSHLAVLYPHSRAPIPWWLTAAACLVLASITALVLAARRHRYLPVGWFWFLGAMVPMLGVVQVGGQAMADRYAYLPLIGLFFMFCWGIAEWAAQRNVPRAALVVCGVAVCLALAVVTQRQIGYWKSNVSLWAHAAALTRDNFQAEANLGRALLDSGHSDQAIAHFRAADAIFPGDPLTHLYLGVWEQQHGKLPEAIHQYQKVLDLTESYIRDYAKLRDNALLNMAVAYRDQGDLARANECFQAVEAQRREYAAGE